MNTISPSGKYSKIVIAMALTILLTLTTAFLPATAFADESSSAAAAPDVPTAPSAGASTAAEVVKDPTGDKWKALGGLPMMGNDYVWLGRELVLSGSSIVNDILAAGQIISLTDVSAMGDFRLAAQTINLKNCMAGENISAAAETVMIENTSAISVVATGRSVTFSGNCDEMTIYAESVFIDGVVSGDVVVGANHVEIGTNARIIGTLRVSAPSEPVMQRGAEVGDVVFTKSESSNAPSTGEVEGAVAGLASAFTIMMAIITVLGTLVVAVLEEWLFRRQTAGAAAMIRNRTGALIGTGVVAALVAPLAVIMLIGLGITIPVAGGIAFALFAMTAIAGGFAGASLFKLVFPKLGRYKCALAGGAIVGVASAIPCLGAVVGAAAFMYLLGYVLQSIYLGMRDPAPTPGAPFTPGPNGQAPVAPAPAPAPMADATTPMPGAPVATGPVPTPPTSVKPEPPTRTS